MKIATFLSSASLVMGLTLGVCAQATAMPGELAPPSAGQESGRVDGSGAISFATTSSPAPMVGGTPCSQPNYTWYDDYYDVLTGLLRASYESSISFPASNKVSWKFGIKDRRADGYPPYFFLKYVYTDGTKTTTGRYHNYQSAAGGWECHSASVTTGKAIRSVEVWFGVDNAPSIRDSLGFTVSR